MHNPSLSHVCLHVLVVEGHDLHQTLQGGDLHLYKDGGEEYIVNGEFYSRNPGVNSVLLFNFALIKAVFCNNYTRF